MPRPSYESSPYGVVNYDRYRTQPGGALMWSPDLQSEIGGVEGRRQALTQQRVQNQRWWENAAKLGSAAIIGGAGMAGMGGATGASAASAAPSITAPTVAGAGGSTLGSILNSDALGLGVGAVTSWLGNRSQNRSTRYVADLNAKNTTETLALERERLEREMANANLDRADALKMQEAINELKRRELDATEEDRAYNRSLVEAREARSAPRREMSARAMRSLGAILGI